ncbi:hypothetical protein ABK040_002278 [Willaertia magna]
MSKRTVIITGANIGLGYECAKDFILNHNKEWNVILACRDKTKALQAISSLKEALQQKNNSSIRSDEINYDTLIQFIPLDLASMTSIRSFVDTIKEKLNNKLIAPLSALVCNAGVQFSTMQRTEDNFEATFGVNHLGHFLLTNLLLPLFDIENYNDNRIIIVSSDTHDPEEKTGLPTPVIKPAKEMAFPKQDETFNGFLKYSTSKLCNVLYTYELAKRIEQSLTYQGKITVNAFNPGLMMGTGLARDHPFYLQIIIWLVSLASPMIRYFFPKFMRNVSDSGNHLARLVYDEKLKGVTGKYFDGLTDKKSSIDSYDKEKQLNLWNESLELVGLNDKDIGL